MSADLARRAGDASVAVLAATALALAAHGHISASPAFYLSGVLLALVTFGPISFAIGRRRWPPAVMRIALMCLSLLFGLCTVDLIWYGVEKARGDEEPSRPFTSYEQALQRPAAFRRWWGRHVREFLQLPIFMKDPLGQNPFVLRPGGDARYYDSEIHINSLGFRGPEIEGRTNDDYRIVAIGESTTFGITMLSDDLPWPRVLERLIEARLSCRRPVTIVNAGVPAWTLSNQIGRMDREIKPLQPDWIVSYHGYNGFHYFFRDLPEVVVTRGELLVERPSRVLSYVERSIQIMKLRARYRAGAEASDTLDDRELMSSAYARLYRDLAGEVAEIGAGLSLATFNMAVTADSPEGAIEFYEDIFPDVRARVRANRLHNRLLRMLGPSLGAHVIETGEGLDGRYADLYTDVVHFNQAGRDILAEKMYVGLLSVLTSEEGPGCRPRT